MQTNLDINAIIKNANDIFKKLGVAPSQITKEIAEKYGIYPTNNGVDDAVDAFRHAYTSAVATYLMGEGVAKAVGDYNEDRIPIPTNPVELENYQKSRNMDLYNNDIGRAIGSTASSLEEIAQRVAEAVRNGQTINGLDDTRQWTEPIDQPQITIPDLLQHPLGRLAFLVPIPQLFLGALQIEILIDRIRSILTSGSKVSLQAAGSPIILDLDKDGVETTALTSGTYFDLDNNGFAEQTGWASSDDGLLVMDRDADGTIDNGTELFGNETLLADGTKATNGFQALAELDSNLDSKIDANDTAWSSLKIWQDTDGDGYSTTEELQTLDELGIQSINTGYTNSTTVDINGNEHKQISTFTWTDGTTNEATDVWFKQDKMYTIANDWVEVPDDIAALPDLQGFGNVYDLHQAMAKERLEGNGEGLKGLIEQFIAATDVTTRNSLIDQIIYQWTGVAGIDPTSRGSQIDARKLEALEELFGEEYVGSTGSDPHWRAKPYIEASYKGLTELVYSQLMAQTHLKDIYNSITYTWDEQTQSIKASMSAAIIAIQTELTANPEAGKILLGELSRTIRGMGAQDTLNYQNFKEAFVSQDPSLEWIIESSGRNIIIGTSANNSIISEITNDAVMAGDGNDAINTSDGDDVIYGQAGNDGIEAGYGNDLLDGGTGNDTMHGNRGDDIYIYKTGYGNDTIADYGTTSDSVEENIDTIQFGPGITPNDLEYIKESGNLKIKLLNTTGEDTLTINDWFAGANYRIEQFKFTDGTMLTPEDIDATGYKMYGTATIDSLAGSNMNDQIYGYEGNDNLYGYEGNDTIEGGTGNDNLRGGAGNDTYIYNLGDGSDTIYDYESTAEGCNTIQLGSGITANDLEFIKQASDLKIKINGTSDILTITNWFYTDSYKIGKLKFQDGSEMALADIEINGYKIYGTTANDSSLYGSTVNDQIFGYEGSDTLMGYAGDDTLIGAQGDDRLYADAGNDIIDGGIGNDYIVGGAGSDTYIYKLGDGTDTIIEFDTTAGNIDTIQFGPGINKTDLEYIKEDDNLRIKIANTTDSLLIQNWFNANNPEYYRIEQFKFTDGTTLTSTDIDATGYKMYGTAANESLYGSNVNDTIYGYDGNDVISSCDGNDTLIGGAGNDALNSGAGQDIIDGGIGSDTLNGGQGNDTYIYSLGDGSDTINDTDSTTGNIDTIQFGEGINSSNIEWIKEGGHLRVKFTNTTDTLLIQNWFSGANYKIERLHFSDGTTLTSADIDTAGFKMYGTTANDSLQGSTVNDEIYGYEGNDNLYGYAGNDILDGGAGTDNLQSGDGSDTLDGGTGNDTLTGGLGSDTYKFAIGSGSDTIIDYETAANTDKIEFGPGIASTDLEYIKEGNNMKIKIIGQTDTLIIQNWFNGTNPNAPYRIEQLKFADGTTITPANIDAIGYKVYGTTANDTNLAGTTVNDEIIGNEGNDNLYGYAGDDILDGGTGNDYMNGSTGNDTYIYRLGDGQDIINDNATDYATTTDTVEMGANSLNIIFAKTSNNLTITNNTNTDQITVQSWYSGAAYQTETIQTADGKHLHNNQVAQLIQAMATFCTTNGVTWNQAIEQKPAETQQVLAQYWSQT